MNPLRRHPGVLVTALASFLSVGLLLAEFVFFTPPGAFAVEVSLQDSPYLRLPIYRNAITSLTVSGDLVVGGTSAAPGMSPFLFVVSLSKKELVSVFDIAQVAPGQRRILSGFGRASDGRIWAGTMPDKEGESGHLLRIRLQGSSIQADDLGVPVPGQGIFALAASRDGSALYGMTHPKGSFFAYDLRTGKSRVFDETAPSRRTVGFLEAYALEPEDFLCRSLVLDARGRVYGSKPVAKLFRYDPAQESIENLPEELPEAWGRKPLSRVDSWAAGPDGHLYGGNAGDGQLFRLDPSNGHVFNLGKPGMMPRIPGLAFGRDGRLYGVSGAHPGYAHLFFYDAAGRGFVDLGNPRFTMTGPGIEQGMPWRGFQIATVAATEDGRWIVLGEDEALSQIMVFPVEGAMGR